MDENCFCDFIIGEFKIVNIVFRMMMNMLVVLKWTNKVLQQRFATKHIQGDFF